MEKTAGHVLKSTDVKLEGRFRLDAGGEAPGRANAGNVTLDQPQVLVVESHPEFAVMEVTCRCGEKTHIRCEYSTNHSTEQKPDTKNDGENDDAS
jgi:hypothetical protein